MFEREKYSTAVCRTKHGIAMKIDFHSFTWKSGMEKNANKKIVAKGIFTPISCDLTCNFAQPKCQLIMQLVFLSLSLATSRHGIDKVCVCVFVTWSTRNALNVSIPVIQSVCYNSIEQICSLSLARPIHSFYIVILRAISPMMSSLNNSIKY